MTADEVLERIAEFADDYLEAFDGPMSEMERRRYPQTASADDALTEIARLIERYRVLGERRAG